MVVLDLLQIVQVLEPCTCTSCFIKLHDLGIETYTAVPVKSVLNACQLEFLNSLNHRFRDCVHPSSVDFHGLKQNDLFIYLPRDNKDAQRYKKLHDILVKYNATNTEKDKMVKLIYTTYDKPNPYSSDGTYKSEW